LKARRKKMPNPGEILRAKRLDKGLSLRDVSEVIKISPSFLEAIENNNLNYLPGGFFKKTFVREYARFLDLDEEYILKAFNLIGNEIQEKEIISKREGIRKQKLYFIFSVFAIILILSLVILYPKNSGQRKEKFNEYSTTNLPISETERTEEVKKEPDKLEIVIKAVEDTWIDASLDGNKILYRIIKKGEEIKLKGREVLFNVIGKPEGIILFINGKESIPLGEPGKVAKNIKIDVNNSEDFLKK
jgi:cytoskeletal protein RodZ